MQNLILQNAIWYVFCDIIIDNKLYVIMDIFVYPKIRNYHPIHD